LSIFILRAKKVINNQPIPPKVEITKTGKEKKGKQNEKKHLSKFIYNLKVNKIIQRKEPR
jgi:hypothetical protein